MFEMSSPISGRDGIAIVLFMGSLLAVFAICLYWIVGQMVNSVLAFREMTTSDVEEEEAKDEGGRLKDEGMTGAAVRKCCEACGERMHGHEDESATQCRWCVTGWKPCEGESVACAPVSQCVGVPVERGVEL